MEEAIVDVALDLNLLPPEHIHQQEAQQGIRTDHRDQAQLLATVLQAEQACTPSPGSAKQLIRCSPRPEREWASSRSQNRAARVETLRQCVANGSYHVDNAELARCILRNSTRFVETC